MKAKPLLTNNNNNQCYLVRVTLNSKADKPMALISRSNWNLECWFLWREENRRTRRKTLGAETRTNNKLNPHVMPGPGIEPGPQRWEVSALTTAPSLFPVPAPSLLPIPAPSLLSLLTPRQVLLEMCTVDTVELVTNLHSLQIHCNV